MFAYILGMTFTSVSHATSTKHFPGNLCHPYYGSEAGHIDNYYDHETRVVRTTYDWLAVTCPVVIDKTNDTSGYYYATINLRRPSFASRSIYCHFSHLDAREQRFRYDGEVFSGSGFGQMRLRLSKSYPDGSYSIRCTLPASAAIINYWIED